MFYQINAALVSIDTFNIYIYLKKKSKIFYIVYILNMK